MLMRRSRRSLTSSQLLFRSPARFRSTCRPSPLRVGSGLGRLTTASGPRPWRTRQPGLALARGALAERNLATAINDVRNLDGVDSPLPSPKPFYDLRPFDP